MKELVDQGNGVYSYIDGFPEARKVLVEQLTGSTIMVAKDVKLQVDFNPARVASYRLLGYENRLLAVKLRFKQPDGDTSTLREYPLADRGGAFGTASADLRFAAVCDAGAGVSDAAIDAATAHSQAPGRPTRSAVRRTVYGSPALGNPHTLGGPDSGARWRWTARCPDYS
ncbi:MAG: YfbK domain-containing protein [Pirellulales bacterium]